MLLHRLASARHSGASFNRIAIAAAEPDAGTAEVACRVIDDLAASLPSGPEQTGAARLAAMARAFGDRLNEAQAKLEELSARSPGDPDVLTSLSTVSRWRGWPGRALDTAERAAAVHPGDASALAVRTAALLDFGRLDEAGETLRQLEILHPDSREIAPLRQTWNLRRRPELVLETSGDSSNSALFGGTELFLYGTQLGGWASRVFDGNREERAWGYLSTALRL